MVMKKLSPDIKIHNSVSLMSYLIEYRRY
ncbi:unnamed protein product [Spirodela intermedia]|uniref:Uncharacterized protein n=1 Tax=Spirodela intermedia TaxID=51605 RepID=A0A7I8K820_SPIIN|nr:unnamed protein product [Spirodela intermedia]